MADINKTIFYLNREQEERHTQEMAAKLNLPYINLAGYPVTREILEIIPEDLAARFRVVPYLKIGKSVKVGAVQPADSAMLKFLERHSKTIGVEFILTVISQSSLLYCLMSYEQIKQKAAEKERAETKEKEGLFTEEIRDIQSLGLAAKKVTTTHLLDVVIAGALKLKASDIHLEPEENDFLTRFRVDGVLQDVMRLPLLQFRQLISRIKYLCKLRLDITAQPQDGRFSVKNMQNEEIDLRVSIMPSSYGEAVVLRLLGQEKSILHLEALGFRSEALAAIREAIRRPHGMVLTSGPTGSGKTSTLYAVLFELKKPGVKIITLEDPIEYRIEGAEQSQVRPTEGYDFAQGLRASLRQDPDILMVGEIRDAESGEIAVQAALTGHLLISTIHSNSAPAVFVRLLEMGIKPFLLSGSINIVMAQRLIRKICPDCREQYAARPEILAEIKTILRPIADRLSPKIQSLLNAPHLSRGRGCAKCNKTGFSGRQVIIEVLVPNEAIELLISRSASISEFEKAARAQGMITMEQDGLIKVLEGLTTVEEVWRVTKD